MNKITKFFALLLAFLALAVLLINIIGKSTGRITTKTATLGVIEKSLDAQGVIIRDEAVLISQEGCFIDSIVTEGERVSKNAILATVYDEGVDSHLQGEIKSLNERINNLKSIGIAESGIGREQSTESLIKSKLVSIVENAKSGNGKALNNIQDEIVNSADRFLASDEGSTSSLISSLRDKKQSLENQISGSKSTLVANKAGYYFSYTDGFENSLYPNAISNMSVGDFKNIPDKIEHKEGVASAKIVSGYDWYVAFLVKEKYSEDFEKASSVTLNFKDRTEENIKASVYYISPAENGECLVACRVEKYVDYAFTNRRLDLNIIIETTEGIKIPKEAVRVIDGEKGVYVVKQSVARFRNIDVIDSDNDFVIIREGNSANNGVIIYDEVIVRGNVKNGQGIR